MLVVRSGTASGDEASTVLPSVAIDNIRGILQSVLVESCRETKSGGLVVKFPSKEAREEASVLLESSLGKSDTGILVSEPKKMLPKMTLLDVPTSLPDADIVPGIRDKNISIRNLLENGHVLTLLFTRTNGDKKMAVLKMSPEIRTAIINDGGHVFLGLSRCRAYDRFWATQCRHCYKFGHTKDRCSGSGRPPTCGFCAGAHMSGDCPDKSLLKCANCSSSGSPPEVCNHSASSLDCPVMISERQKAMENTNFGLSKNL